MANKRRICVVTGSRAEYGLLRPLLEEIRKDSALELQLIATCMHLSAEFGFTYREIEKDGFAISEKVDMRLGRDDSIGVSRSMGVAMAGFGETYRRLSPDIAVVLGDRFELLSAAACALVSRIPLAHIGGGEITEGAFDDSIRHAITKMSHYHFTALEAYRNRVIQLGEPPERVFNVGALGVDNIMKMELLSRNAVEKELGIEFDRRNILVTFHPVTLENDTAGSQFRALLNSLSRLKNTRVIFTKTNADPNGKIINNMIDKYSKANHGSCAAFASLGQLRYLSAMKHMDAVVGNSSSGIIEASSFKIGTINIGDRQKGRVRPESVIDCEPTERGIEKAFKRLYSRTFQETLKTVRNPYGEGNAAGRIKDILKKCALKDILKKRFYAVDIKTKHGRSLATSKGKR